MKILTQGCAFRKTVLWTLLGILAVALSAVDVLAQGNPPNQPKRAIRMGYTRPGLPNDKEKDGKVLPVAWDPAYKGKLLGGTVYFAVFERTGAEGDTWGTGLANFDEMFAEGRSFNNTFSPALDSKAKFLYLYMVVNDRGLDPVKGDVIPAAWKEFKTEDIYSATVKLHVDPRYITSWGHFRNSSFGARVIERDIKGAVVMAADGMEAKHIKMAISSNPSVLAELPHQQYLSRSPAYPLGDLRDAFGLTASNLNLKNSKAYNQLAVMKEAALKEKEPLRTWQETMLKNVNGKEPTFVQLLYPTAPAGGAVDAQPAVMGAEGEVLEALAYFRADFQGDATLQLANHSVVFGFTTDLPPMETELRIDDKEAARSGAAIRPVVAGAGADAIALALATGSAPGTGVTPMPPAPVAEAGFGGSGGVLGGQVGGGMGVPSGPAVGAIGTAPPAVFSGGGGTGGGNGGGNGGGTGNGNGKTNTGTNTNGQNNQSLQVNFNATLVNQQAQAQAQAQSQRQSQHQHQNQNNCNCPPGEVVPSPAAFLLGLFGLPALFFIRRRKALVPEAVAAR